MEITQKHYQRLADNYDNFLVYSPDFVRTLTTRMIDKLALQPDDVLVDLGGGTGIYCRDILEQVPLKHPVILVDPFEEMLAQVPKGTNIECVLDTAEGFADKPGHYNKVLIKEAIHHVKKADRPPLFAKMADHLPTGGKMLLVHIPPEIDYPLFDKALERSKRWHANPKELAAELKEAGFDVEVEGLDYRHNLPKEKYFEMVAGQYMSLLSSFDDHELREGLAEMEQRYAERDTLSYIDHFDFITATKRGE